MILNSLAQAWAQSLTEKERVTMTPLIQLSYNVAKATLFDYDFNKTFDRVPMEDDAAVIDIFKEKAVADDALQNELTPHGFSIW